MTWWLEYNTLVVLAGGGLLGLGAGVIGCFALLKKRSLTGDALAHASLPGICCAFLLAGERNMPILLLGALVSGVLGIGIMAFLRRWTRTKEDAALGIVLSVPYGLGVVLLSLIQSSPAGNQAGLGSFLQGKTAGLLLEDVYWMAALLGVGLVTVLGLFKEFRLVSFDPDFASVQGWPTHRLDFLIMSLVVVVVVVGLPTVGVLLMAALLIIPPAAARFWTERLGVMVALGGAFGLAAGVTGTLTSAAFASVPAGPAIILAAGAMFLISLVFAPARGLLRRILAVRSITVGGVEA